MATVLKTLKVPFHRFIARHRFQDLAYLSSDRQLREELGPSLNRVCRRAVQGGWTTRTTAGVLGAIWIGRLARLLDPDRRMRLGQEILAQEKAGLSALDWLHEFDSSRMNLVGIDVFLVRFNMANGTLASWIAEGRAVDPGVRRIFLSMAAWSLAGLLPEEIESRFERLVSELDDAA